MNKSLKLMPCVLALTAVFLVGCKGGNGGTLSEKEKQAIQKAMGMPIATVSGTTAAIPGQASDVEGDNNDYVQLTIKQSAPVDGEKFEVDIEWTYAGFESDVLRYRTIDGDEYHKNLEFNFPNVGAPDKVIEVVGTPSIGGKKGDAVKYSFNLKAMKLEFPEWSIAEIYKIKGDGSMFTHISDPVKGYFESNQNPDVTPYCYVKTYGEVIYLAPDGNWGLLADGDKFIELYAGSAYNLNTKTYADLKLNEKVYVYGEPTHYQGNIQIGYISKVEKMSDPQKVQGVTDAKAINGSYLSTTGQICQDMNRLVSLRGTFKSKAMPSTDSARGTFVVAVDGVELEIAYDYHTSKEGSSTLYEEIMTIVNGAVKDTTMINVKGTLRWVNTGGDIFGGAGHWTVAPYVAGHVTQ